MRRLGDIADKYGSNVAIGCATLYDALNSDDKKLLEKTRKRLIKHNCLIITEDAMKAEGLWPE